MFPRRLDSNRIAPALAGMPYPARSWQLFAQAEHYGADRHTRRELARLPAGTYQDLDAVLGALREVNYSSPATARRAL